MPITDSASIQGWLMKQKHGLYRSWQKRYFVLQGRELSYYRHETDKVPQNVLDLDHYTISFKKQSRRNCTFVLVAEEHYMQPDYYLQAESKDHLDIWVSHLQQHMSTSSVLDKWLERLDMSCSPQPRQQQESPSSCTSLHVPTISYHSHHHQQQQQQQHTLRSHHSVESIHTFCSLPSVSHHRVSFTNDRRPSSQSTHSNNSTTSNISNNTSNSTTRPPALTPSSITSSSSSTISSTSGQHKFFASRLFSRKQHQQQHRQSPQKQRSLDAMTSYNITPDEEEQQQEDEDQHSLEEGPLMGQPLFSSDDMYSHLVTSIILPSEYNHDDDPQERLLRRQQKEQEEEQVL
ncbi:hypothetical protein BC941DRAFT_515836 [Chlamydoabsidia padenii]|nr:hypothetical protein BC941DRAFT_515836 [Chlamydoabsidia padenii]